MSPKSGFLLGKTHIPCPLFIVMRTLKILQSIFIFTTITSTKHDENEMEEQIIPKKG